MSTSRKSSTSPTYNRGEWAELYVLAKILCEQSVTVRVHGSKGPGNSLDVQRDAAFAGPSHAHFSMEPRVGDPRNTSTRQFTSSTSSVAERMLNQHSAHAAAGITSRPASPSAQRSTARDTREGEVLRNLLNHLRELKEKV